MKTDRETVIKNIIIELKNNNGQNKTYSMRDIHAAISKSRDIIDSRSIANWFSYLWRQGVFEQVQPGEYKIKVCV